MLLLFSPWYVAVFDNTPTEWATAYFCFVFLQLQPNLKWCSIWIECLSRMRKQCPHIHNKFIPRTATQQQLKQQKQQKQQLQLSQRHRNRKREPWWSGTTRRTRACLRAPTANATTVSDTHSSSSGGGATRNRGGCGAGGGGGVFGSCQLQRGMFTRVLRR